LGAAILSARFIIPGWGINKPLYVALLNVFCVIAGLWVVRKILANYFTDLVTAITMIALVAGTNLFCLTTYEPDLLHPLLFLFYALILWFTLNWQKTFSWNYAIFLGLIIALTISIRLQEIACILIPLFWGILNKTTFDERRRALMQHYWQGVLVISLFMIAVLAQIVFPDFLSGILNAGIDLQKNHFTFIGPYLPDVLLSFRKGWLIYTPVMFFSIIGFYFLAGKNPFIFYSTFLFFLINLYIVSSWSIWWDDESFGQRSMISSYPVLALPMGYFLNWLMQKKMNFKIPLFIFLGAFILLNVFQTWQYTKGILDSSHMTRKYWGAIFGAVREDKEAAKYLLEDFPDSYREMLRNEHRFNRRILVHWNFDKPDPAFGSAQTKDVSHSGSFSYKLNEKVQFSPGISEKFSNLTNKKNTWIRVSGYVYYTPENAIKGANIIITCNHQNSAYKYKSLALENEYLISGKWNRVSMDWQTPYLMDKDDLLQAYFWYVGKKSIYVDDIQIEIFEPRE